MDEEEINYKQYKKRAVLSSHLSLTQTITDLFHHLEIGDVSKEDLPLELIAAQDVNGLDSFLNEQLEPIYYNEQGSKDSSTARRVFNLQQLTDLILQYLKLREIMPCRQISTNFRDNITNSVSLQQKLFLVPKHVGNDCSGAISFGVLVLQDLRLRLQRK